MKSNLGNTLARYATGVPFDILFNTRTAVAASPTYNVSYCLAAARADNGSPADTVLTEIEIIYTIEFSAPASTYYS